MQRAVLNFFLNVRDLIVSAGWLVVLIIGLLVGAYWWLQPQPPHTVSLATGPEDSAYANFGKRYAKALAEKGITVELIATAGSSENLHLLRSGKADVAFVRGGSVDVEADEAAGLQSLGALYYEPLWLFYRKGLHRTNASAGKVGPITTITTITTMSTLTALSRLRIDVGPEGNGVSDIMAQLFKANKIDPSQLDLSHGSQPEAVAALLAGKLDVVALASAPQSRGVQQLLRADQVGLVELAQTTAYTRRFPFLSDITLPRGVIDLSRDLPPHDVSLLAATTSLLVREDTHPALRQAFAQVAQGIHSHGGWLNRAREFPNTRTSELPVSPEGDRAINGSPPFWQRYLPFWASNLVERMWLVVGGLIVLLLPLSRIVPPIYTFRVRRRVFRWYARLRAIETHVEAGTGERTELLQQLDELDQRVNAVALPLSHTAELFDLRNNIYATRKRLCLKRPA